MTGRRGFALVVLVCAAAAMLVVLAAGRTWTEELVARPAPLPELRTTHTGGALRPWLPALGWVGLAGAGALLATRGMVRRLVGGLLVAAGAGIAAGAATALTGGWPALAAAGGLVIAATGWLAVRYGRDWPAMSARYERIPTKHGDPPTSPERLWEALDRGEDPTAR